MARVYTIATRMLLRTRERTVESSVEEAEKFAAPQQLRLEIQRAFPELAGQH